jgi:lysyl-tRNA synthetase class II
MFAGRIMGKRVFGKLAFYTLADSEGEIQLYLEQDAIKAAGGDESFEDLKVSFVHCIKSLHVHIRSLLTR